MVNNRLKMKIGPKKKWNKAKASNSPQNITSIFKRDRENDNPRERKLSIYIGRERESELRRP